MKAQHILAPFASSSAALPAPKPPALAGPARPTSCYAEDRGVGWGGEGSHRAEEPWAVHASLRSCDFLLTWTKETTQHRLGNSLLLSQMPDLLTPTHPSWKRLRCPTLFHWGSSLPREHILLVQRLSRRPIPLALQTLQSPGKTSLFSNKIETESGPLLTDWVFLPSCFLCYT